MTSPYSPYMEFAKTRQTARYTLATSGIAPCPTSLLPVKMEDIEINGPGGYGYTPLLQALAKRYGVDESNVVAATGTSMANYLAMGALLRPGDDVLIESPAYELIVAAARYIGAGIQRFHRRPEDRYGIDVDQIRRQWTTRTKLVVLTNLHNPSSALLDEATLRSVGDVAREAGAHVLVDEVYLESLFECAPPSAFHLGPQFVVTNSLTKVYGLSGLRCGWILAASELAYRMSRLNDLFGVVPAHPAERLSVVALRHLEAPRERARGILERNRPALNRFLASRPDLDSLPHEHGTVAFPRRRSGSVEALCALLREKYETTVVSGHFFGMPHHFRIGIGGDHDMTVEGLRRIGLALDALQGA